MLHQKHESYKNMYYHWKIVFIGWDSVSLGTDPSYKTRIQQFFLSSQAMKNLASLPGQTKSLDNFNVLYMFNNNTFTDFRTAYKDVLIPSYVIQVI